jgi:NADH dehydrogenase
MAWAWDYFDRDHAAIVEGSTAPQRIVWGDEVEDLPHIVVGDDASPTTPAQGT